MNTTKIVIVSLIIILLMIEAGLMFFSPYNFTRKNKSINSSSNRFILEYFEKIDQSERYNHNGEYNQKVEDDQEEKKNQVVEDGQEEKENQNKHTPYKIENALGDDGCYYGVEVPQKLYLEVYAVQKGDTLLSIAERELGSAGRVDELINLNKNRLEYFSLYFDDQIEEGWELYLPSKNIPPNSGDLKAWMGVFKVHKTDPRKGLPFIRYDYISTYGAPISINEDTVFIGSNNFKEGDCVIVIYDEEIDDVILLATQDPIDSIVTSDLVYSYSEIVDFPKEELECNYEYYGSDKVLREYVVKRGDTLQSIAEEQLGDASKVEELVSVNNKRYQRLNKNSFIEVGWVLLLPPSWVRGETKGSYHAFAGIVVQVDSDGYWVSRSRTSQSRTKFTVEPTTRLFDKEKYEVGDCIVGFSSMNIDLGIASQDIDFIKAFKYGDY